MREKIESLQLLNTAIIKTQEKKINVSYEERLKSICNSPVIDAIDVAITHLAETQKISRDQSAVQIIETVMELDALWADYVMMEGIDSIKGLLNKKTH